jgi:hypothetical protein
MLCRIPGQQGRLTVALCDPSFHVQPNLSKDHSLDRAGAAMWKRRKKIWIDRFQTLLCLRLSILFLCYQIAVWLLFILGRVLLTNLGVLLGGPLNYWLYSLVGGVGALCLLFLYDTVKFSPPLVGPLYRFRMVVKAITAGEELSLVQLRKGDFLGEMRDEINEMLLALEQRGAIVLKDAKKKEVQFCPQPV